MVNLVLRKEVVNFRGFAVFFFFRTNNHSRPKADGALSVRRREDSTEEWEDLEENDEEDDGSTVPRYVHFIINSCIYKLLEFC